MFTTKSTSGAVPTLTQLANEDNEESDDSDEELEFVKA